MRKPASFPSSADRQLRGRGGTIARPGSLPVEIKATGQTTYENGIATARDNVAIHFGDTDIYSDFAHYDSAKHAVRLKATSEFIAASRFTSGRSSLQRRHQRITPATCVVVPSLTLSGQT